MNKRQFSKLMLGSTVMSAALACSAVSGVQESSLIAKAIDVEARLGARLGLSVIDHGTGMRWLYNADQRFPMCSTFKVLAAGALLSRVDKGLESLEKEIHISSNDLVSYSPVTESFADKQPVSLGELCAAALTMSDNTAGNKILEHIGGPEGLTRYARSIGDHISRLDRWETELNAARVGDARDTTSPLAISSSLGRLVLGDLLTDKSKNQLRTWMIANKTGDAKLRAGLPSDWTIGDKTGGGDNGTMADIAVVWPKNKSPLVVAVYMTETTASFDDRNAGIAEIASAISAEITRG